MPLRFALPALALLALACALVFLLPVQDFTPPSNPNGLIGKPVPDFALPALAAGEKGLKSSDLKGQISVINVFASWCVPCRAEHPLLADFAKSGIVLIGIAYKDKPEAARHFLTEHGNPYRVVLSDTDGRTATAFALAGVPETYIVDRNGIIRFRQAGPLTETVIASDIRPLLKRLQ